MRKKNKLCLGGLWNYLKEIINMASSKSHAPTEVSNTPPPSKTLLFGILFFCLLSDCSQMLLASSHRGSWYGLGKKKGCSFNQHCFITWVTARREEIFAPLTKSWRWFLGTNLMISTFNDSPNSQPNASWEHWEESNAPLSLFGWIYQPIEKRGTLCVLVTWSTCQSSIWKFSVKTKVWSYIYITSIYYGAIK